MCHLLFCKGHTSKSVFKRSLSLKCPPCASQQFTTADNISNLFLTSSRLKSCYPDYLSEILVSLRYQLEGDICDDLILSESGMNTEAERARDREGVARSENALG